MELFLLYSAVGFLSVYSACITLLWRMEYRAYNAMLAVNRELLGMNRPHRLHKAEIHEDRVE